ncbi:MAG: tryptophan synthase subunit alpha [Alphaproteobacteria bacterium]|nr:tryptophan synthase subunit alpha [Alphaproteobacteria bacterium]HRW30081.1 tryptophan synthase subunit alpha [Emcibacteraceae bacterium]
MGISRINKRFETLKSENRAGLITFTTAGDPDYETSLALLKGLPAAGADIIELGMPFSDPMADGPAIQAASIRALKGKMTLKKTLKMVESFREDDDETPIILMGYYNPIYIYGVDRFLDDALKAGIDGLIIVDLPPEEDSELAIPAKAVDMAMIHLATPTTDQKRLGQILENGSGFLYYVTIAGITGTAKPDLAPVKQALDNFRKISQLPMAVGFGIKSAEDAARFAKFADAVVVGSAIVDVIKSNINQENVANSVLESRVLSFVGELANGVKNARK